MTVVQNITQRNKNMTVKTQKNCWLFRDFILYFRVYKPENIKPIYIPEPTKKTWKLDETYLW